MATTPSSVAFEILFRTAGSGERPTMQTLDRFRPSADAMARCRRWLEDRDVTVHPTGFSLACSATPAVFESLFGVQLTALDAKPERPRWRVVGRVQIPPDISAWVEEVTLPPPPELMPGRSDAG